MFYLVLNEYKMVSCRAPGCTNRAYKNSNTMALVTITVMLV